MRFLSFLPKSRNRGFTMIELLIVIAILGILAVAVLSAINPIEQINRGRDTGNRSDAEQLLSAIDRYTAFVGYYPWQFAVNADTTGLAWTDIDSVDAVVDGGNPTSCNMLEKLAGGNLAGTCEGTDELKVSFIDRIVEADYNNLFIFNNGGVGDSTYVCFEPQSRAFLTEAETRCSDSTLPTDYPPNACNVAIPDDPETPENEAVDGTFMICLP